MHRNRLADESNRARAARDCKKLERKLAALHHWPSARMSLAIRRSTISGRAMRTPRRATTTTRVRRTTTSRAHRRICRAPTAERPPPQFGDEIFAVRWSAMRADSTLSFTVSIGHIRCDVTRFTRADVVQRVTSRTEEVS